MTSEYVIGNIDEIGYKERKGGQQQLPGFSFRAGRTDIFVDPSIPGSIVQYRQPHLSWDP
jgi:hypothetical protein